MLQRTLTSFRKRFSPHYEYLVLLLSNISTTAVCRHCLLYDMYVCSANERHDLLVPTYVLYFMVAAAGVVVTI